jgi:hypothetical protein
MTLEPFATAETKLNAMLQHGMCSSQSRFSRKICAWRNVIKGLFRPQFSARSRMEIYGANIRTSYIDCAADSGKASNLIVRSSVGISDGSLASLWSLVVLVRPSRQTPGYNLDYATTTSFQIPSIIHPSSCQYYLSTDSVAKLPKKMPLKRNINKQTDKINKCVTSKEPLRSYNIGMSLHIILMPVNISTELFLFNL